jgi:hypothetical protein
MARLSDIARMNDMAVEILTQKSKYPLMMRVAIYHLTKSHPLDLNTV